MREQLEKFLRARPFRPFALELDNDTAYAIATADHASLLRSILVVEDDSGAADLIAIRHITRLRIEEAAL